MQYLRSGQDGFVHCTDPVLKQERINVTRRWISSILLPVHSCDQEWYVV